MQESLTVVARERGVCCDITPALDESSAMATAALLRAMSDPTRLAMLATLRTARQPVCICDFTNAYALSQPTISHHMGKLRDAGLVTAERRGIWTYYAIADPLPAPVAAVMETLGAGKSTPR